MQAQTVLRRLDDANRLWRALEEVAAQQKLAERTVYALYPAVLGLRVRRSLYPKDAELEVGTANRDLRLMVAAELLVPHGQTRGRYYLATPALREVHAHVARARPPLRDPYAAT